MNKLILSNEDDINNIVVEEDTELEIRLNSKEKIINIIVKENIVLKILEISSKSSNTLKCRLEENSRVIYDKFGFDCNDLIEVDLNGINSNFILNNDIVNTSNLESSIKVTHNNIKTTSEINNKGINYSKDNLNLSVDVLIGKDCIDSYSNQINKIININGGKSLVLPNLLVDNKDVYASHSCYIGDFNKNDIFYLMSRGINEKDARRLLVDSLLFEKMNLEDNNKEEILNILKDWR